MRAVFLLTGVALLISAQVARAQDDPHAGHVPPPDPVPSEKSPAPSPLPAATLAPAPPPPAPGHPVALPDQPAPPPAAADPHAGHAMPPQGDAGLSQAPPVPADHAADRVFDPAVMARAREELRRENGAITSSTLRFDLAEVAFRRGKEGYRWDAEAWIGGDINRLVLTSEGEGTFGEAPEAVELQALYARAISPFWFAQVGVRHDVTPNPSRTYGVIGVEGIAPYWFHVNAQLYLSDRGDLHARAKASHDMRITQRLILQPRLELDLAAQDVPAIGIGSGLSSAELGARLRYEIRKEFAPYVGVEWARKFGDTARYARLAGEDPDTVSVVAGIRFWF